MRLPRHISAHRALLGILVSLGLLIGVTAPAQASAATPQSAAAADWLESQLTNGLVVNKQFPDFTDYGLTLDFFFAFEQVHVKPTLRDQILDAIEPHTDAYVGDGTSESDAAQLGKLLTAVETDGVDPATYADGTLMSRLLDRVVKKGDQRGRAKDKSSFGNFTETIGQAWVVRALALAGRPLTQATTAFLLRQQCTAGFFREKMRPADSTCQQSKSDPSVDATAFAVMALKEARRAGVTGLGDDIRAALQWLLHQQNANGSFTGNGEQNANTTGLAGTVLLQSGEVDAAGRAAQWLRHRQATHANSDGTPLSSDIGAVAYNKAAFAAGETDGITDEASDQWRRATAQAAPALEAGVTG